MKKAVCIMSGGMDSTLCAVMAKKAGYDIVALHFDYGQRTMKREKRAFNEICERLSIAKKMSLDVSFIAQIGGNSLTDESLQIRKDGVEKDVPNTYVPFRNGIFISVAAALAEKENAQAIYIGVVEEDNYSRRQRSIVLRFRFRCRRYYSSLQCLLDDSQRVRFGFRFRERFAKRIVVRNRCIPRPTDRCRVCL